MVFFQLELGGLYLFEPARHLRDPSAFLGSLYPDLRFQEKQPVWIGVLLIFLPLAGYYIAPYLLISRHIVLPPPIIGLCFFSISLKCPLLRWGRTEILYLRLQKGLIEDGLFARTRNPNYLGEILIYVGFAIMSWHWLPFLVLAGCVFGFFLRNMWAKDRSMARYPTFASYKARTGMLFPKLW